MENKILTIITEDEKEISVIDSREVAEMLEVKHYKILEKLEGTKDGKTKGIIPVLADHEIVVSEYFIKSDYTDSTGRTNKCYLFTKKGCEFIANKFTGEKGILFTAKYVERFNKMEKEIIKLNAPSYILEDPIERARRWADEQEKARNERLKLEGTIKKITTHSLTIEDSKAVINRLVRKVANTVYHGKFSNCWDALYNKFNYLEGINIRARKRDKNQSMLDTLNEKEIYNLELVVRNWCVEHNIDIDEQLKLK